MSVDWLGLRELIETHDNILVTSHVRPDGDSIGSLLGMGRLLDQMGKSAQLICPSPLPPRYQFLDVDSRIVFHQEADESAMRQASLILILDTSAWIQLASMADFIRSSPAIKAIIDHHVGHDDIGAVLFKDVKAPACGSLLVDATEPLGCTLTQDVAEPLFVAIATDTGWFRFSSSVGATYRQVGKLVDAGVSPQGMYRHLYEGNSMGRLRLLGACLSSLKTQCHNRVAYITISLADLKRCEAVPQDSEDFVNYTISLEGVDVGLMFIEQLSGSIKVSFRSKNDLDCTLIAGQFGGGGHKAAAGAMLDGPIESACERVLEAVTRAIEQ